LNMLQMIIVLDLSCYEKPLWLRMIEKFRGILFVTAIAYILCFVSVTLLITFLELDVEAIFALELMFYFGFWLLGASIWIVLIGWILRSKNSTEARGGAFRGKMVIRGGYL